MKKIISSFELSGMTVAYVEENGIVGLLLIPSDGGELDLEAGAMAPLVQLRTAGMPFAGGFSAGHSMADSPALYGFTYAGQEKSETVDMTEIKTVMDNGGGLRLVHTLRRRAGDLAVEVFSTFENGSGQTQTVELLSSASIGFITPYKHDPAADALILHRARSFWSAEGRIESVDTDELDMERSWAGFGYRAEKFGQTGSMPVRRFFPFAAVTDKNSGVTWAMQLGIAASWQIELSRGSEFMSLTGGLADWDFGHFRKNVAAGESFVSPSAYLSVVRGGVDEATQRLLTVFENDFERRHPERIPMLFNEYCTTWGVPSQENIAKILARLHGSDIDYFVIDAGWYAPENGGWGDSGGDWRISERLFPDGLDKTVKAINSEGMKAGIWFELETCAGRSEIYGRPEMLLQRDGKPLTVGARRFLDMRRDEVQAYLTERVTGLLAKNGFKYMKVDYNDSIGMGCDGGDSMGEALYENIEGSKRFFRSVKAAIPDIILECCSSGGHRLEPSMLGLFDMASFSDAHECVEIPIIARNLHRLMLPAEEQIWAVLRGSDDLKRVMWSVTAGFFGVLCLSGDVFSIDGERWESVNEGIAFYRSISEVIKRGETEFYGDDIVKYRHPEGWQGIIRRSRSGDEAYALAFMYGGELPDEISMPVGEGMHIDGVYALPSNKPVLKDGRLSFGFTQNFEAAAVRLKRG